MTRVPWWVAAHVYAVPPWRAAHDRKRGAAVKTSASSGVAGTMMASSRDAARRSGRWPLHDVVLHVRAVFQMAVFRREVVGDCGCGTYPSPHPIIHRRQKPIMSAFRRRPWAMRRFLQFTIASEMAFARRRLSAPRLSSGVATVVTASCSLPAKSLPLCRPTLYASPWRGG
jgi:hypothetical protein